jgi:catechol 2,3-dioxygenase-like lactoylglutathione lyase family enzyme
MPHLPPKVAQVGIVVRDIEASIASWEALLGVGVSFRCTTEPGDAVHQSFQGRPSQERAHLAFFNLENIQIELIQPLGGDTVWQDALDRRGEHVQHLAFWVEDMGAYVQMLGDHAIPLSQRGDMGEGQYAYFDADATLGTTLELLESRRTERV